MNEVVKEIYSLIGAKGFFMLGAKNIGYDNNMNYLQFKISGCKKFTHIRIAYNAGKDLYDLDFFKMKGLDNTPVNHEKSEDIYNDMVRDIIEHKTGLYLSI